MESFNASETFKDIDEKNHIPQIQSLLAPVRNAVENNRVELIGNMFSFIVQSNNEKTYSVQLFPKE